MFVEIERSDGIPLQLAECNVGLSFDLAFVRNDGDIELVTVDIDLRRKRRGRRVIVGPKLRLRLGRAGAASIKRITTETNRFS